MAAQPAVSAQVVGNAFVQQYYHILHHSPNVVFRFYQDISKLGRPEEDGSMSITTTMEAINEKILSLNYADLIAEIESIDAQESLNGGVSVLVTGYLTGKDNEIQNFSQSFFLAPQDRGYFVLNDLFRYTGTVNQQDRSHIPVVNVATSNNHNKHKRGRANQTTVSELYINLEANINVKNLKPAAPPPPPPPKEPPAFSCPVCMGPLVEEMTTKCGHIFCKNCIKTSISQQGNCPTCRRKIGAEDIMRVYLPLVDFRG